MRFYTPIKDFHFKVIQKAFRVATTNNLFSGGDSQCESTIVKPDTEQRTSCQASPHTRLQFWETPWTYPSFTPEHWLLPKLHFFYYIIIDTWLEERNWRKLPLFIPHSIAPSVNPQLNNWNQPTFMILVYSGNTTPFPTLK